MYASVVVLSAFVAVTAGQFIYSPASWAYPTHSITGQPLDTPEVAVAKAKHAVQWNHEAARTSPHIMAPVVAAPMYLRKRREAPASETPEAQTQETADTPKDKRQILSMPLATYGYSPLAYSAYPYSAALSYSAYSAYPYAAAPAAYLLRKRRDVSSEETKAPETNDEEKKEKRQILSYAWSSPLAYSAYSPYAAIPYSTYSYTTSPFLFRKRRDTSAAAEEEATTEQSENREKRQYLLPYTAYTAPAVIPYSGFHAGVYRAPIAYYG